MRVREYHHYTVGAADTHVCEPSQYVRQLAHALSHWRWCVVLVISLDVLNLASHACGLAGSTWWSSGSERRKIHAAVS
jgi:hypothetical protein